MHWFPALPAFVCFFISPGQLTGNEGEMNAKLWVALTGGRVVVFDAASWSMLHDCIQVGESQLVRADLLLCLFLGLIFIERRTPPILHISVCLKVM